MHVSIRKVIVINLLLAAAFCVLVAWYISSAQNTFHQALVTQISEVETELKALAIASAPDTARLASGNVISDCDARSEYNEMLSQLSTLRGDELVRAQALHDACGSFSPIARATKALVLFERVEALATLVSLKDQFGSDTDENQRLAQWVAVTQHEATIAGYLSDLNKLQRSIIAALIDSDTDEVNMLVVKAQDTSELLEVETLKLQSLQNQLLAL